MGKTAVVIGSGFGGLALAVRLQSAGIETTLVEARPRPGGRAYVWEERGFVFDAGPTVVTDPDCLHELFRLTGRRTSEYVELMPVTPFYRLVWEDGTVFDYSNDNERLLAQIAALEPADVEGYRRFMAFSEAVYEEGYRKLGTEAFCDLGTMLKAAPALLRHEAYRSVHAIVARYIRHPRLREAFSFHTLLVGGNPFATSSVYALIHALEKKGGVWFPRGGTHALVRALVRLFEDLGGRVLLGVPVERIETAGDRANGVLLADGRLLKADAVASNGDVVHTYRDLLGHHPRGEAMARRLARKSFSPSLFVVYFGLRCTYPEIRHHTIVFGPRYRELLRDIYDHGILARDFSLYLHHPTATDPALAPEGCSTFYVLSPVPHLGKFAADWGELGPRYADRILAYLDERGIVPGLRENLVVRRLFTPADFREELKAHLGSAFSLEPVLWQSAYFRTHNRDDAIRNLFFVGAGTHPGAGIPGVVGSAKATAKLMLAELGARYPDPPVWPANAGPVLAAVQ
ncbi:MAG: phytoene desaturase [Sphingomonadaceae bacterium]|uniref:phytoene desaturase n=1 Tax=Thermaurantiacus sp. TaxID=2820283 RepID=UPI00298EE112|nr:phytoene desaturase [Thermaurantiacus sp.]MCS6987697.1 phytoene desaturase [Sphingomonadaceae bacterium]MDW8415084.1 phytoene desaturase [Thermaurantiacus sp.]